MTTHPNNRPQDDGASQNPINGWQIVYTGFILILLCFFVMLTSFASLQQSKITRFSQAFSQAVSVFSGGRSLEQGKTMIRSDAMVAHKEDEIALLFEKVRQLGIENQLHQVQMSRSRRGVVMTLTEKLLFGSGNPTLTPSALPLLDKVAAIIKTIDVPVEIEGHTDDLPIRTTNFPSNWELATARAVSVLRYMIEAHQVSARRISAVGFSMYRPVAPNDSAANRAINRRVEIVFKTKGSHAN